MPALTGLGSPWWDPDARGLVSGLTRGTTRAHLVRAALEAIAHQVADVVDALPEPPTVLRADGGATANGFLMQLQADLLGCPVEVAAERETTALGAAALAGAHRGAGPHRQALRAAARTAATSQAARGEWRDGAAARDRQGGGVSRIDIHQHLWPEPFVEALSPRDARRRACSGSRLEIQGDTVWDVDLDAHRVEQRLALLDRFELDTAVISLQPTLGLDRLAAEERAELVARGRTASLALAGERAARAARDLGAASRVRRALGLGGRVARPARPRAAGSTRWWRTAGFSSCIPPTATVPAGQAGLVAGGGRLRRRRCRPRTRRGCSPASSTGPSSTSSSRSSPAARRSRWSASSSRGVEERVAIRPRIWLDSRVVREPRPRLHDVGARDRPDAVRQRRADRRSGARPCVPSSPSGRLWRARCSRRIHGACWAR